MGFNIDMQKIQDGCIKGFGFITEQSGKLCEKGGVIVREGKVLLDKGWSVLSAGGDKAVPYLQGNTYVSGAAFFVASLVIIRFSFGFGDRAKNIVNKEHESTRIFIHDAVALLSIGCLFWKALQFVDRKQLPLTWFPMAMLGLCAVGLQGNFSQNNT